LFFWFTAPVTLRSLAQNQLDDSSLAMGQPKHKANNSSRWVIDWWTM